MIDLLNIFMAPAVCLVLLHNCPLKVICSANWLERTNWALPKDISFQWNTLYFCCIDPVHIGALRCTSCLNVIRHDRPSIHAKQILSYPAPTPIPFFSDLQYQCRIDIAHCRLSLPHKLLLSPPYQIRIWFSFDCHSSHLYGNRSVQSIRPEGQITGRKIFAYTFHVTCIPSRLEHFSDSSMPHGMRWLNPKLLRKIHWKISLRIEAPKTLNSSPPQQEYYVISRTSRGNNEIHG